MESKSKLVVLELLAGLAGWVWIGASIVALYFFATAVFSDGTWSRFLLALGTSIVAKLLARSFETRKLKAASELVMVEGSSPEQSPREENDAARNIQAYGKILETSALAPGTVADESKLPYPKAKIKEAIVAGLRITDDEQMKDHLKSGYLQLADWQPGVGQPNQGLDLSNLDTSDDAELLADAVLEHSSGDWLSIVQKEEEDLKRELVELGLW